MAGQQQQQAVRMPQEIWVLVAAAFIIALGYGLIAPLLPQFIVSFDVSMAAAGLVVAVFSASRLVMAPAAGVFVNKLGSRKVYLAGLLTVAVTTGLIAAVDAYWQIVALRALAGIGSTMFTVSALGLIVKLAPASIRGRCSATYATAFLIGNIIGPLVGASLSFLGFRWPFFIYGIGVALAAAVVWLRMPKVDPKQAARSALPAMTLREALNDSAYRAALASNFSHGWVNMGMRVSVLPLFAAAAFTNGGAASGFALAAFAAGTAITLQFSGRFADSIGRRPLVIVGLGASAVFMSLMGLSTQIWSLIIVSALAGAAAGLVNPSQQAAVADVIGSERSGGQVLSTYQMAMDVGMMLGPIAIGALADAYGFQRAFAVSGTIALIGLIAWLFAREPLEGAGARLRLRLISRLR